MSDKREKACPLCTEEMDLTDQQLKPCKCGYEICVWCWNHIVSMSEKDGTNGRCPACRTPYDKEKVVGMAAKCESLVAEISLGRKQKAQKEKPKASQRKKHLSSVRVIQRDLVHVNGLPFTIADEELLKKCEYFGQYGEVLKVSISPAASGVIHHSSNDSFSVYITYSKEEEAIRCIQSVHNYILEGRSLRACFGTTKYCNSWLKNSPCRNPHCLYLHDFGSPEDSFSKDEIASAFKRITEQIGATQHRSGNVLPPPLEEYNNFTISSASNPAVNGSSNISKNQVKGSIADTSTGKSTTPTMAAKWVPRVSTCLPSVPNSSGLTEPGNPKPDTSEAPRVLPSTVVSIEKFELYVAKLSMEPEESSDLDGKLDPSKTTVNENLNTNGKLESLSGESQIHFHNDLKDGHTTVNRFSMNPPRYRYLQEDISIQHSEPMTSVLKESGAAVNAEYVQKEGSLDFDGQDLLTSDGDQLPMSLSSSLLCLLNESTCHSLPPVENFKGNHINGADFHFASCDSVFNNGYCDNKANYLTESHRIIECPDVKNGVNFGILNRAVVNSNNQNAEENRNQSGFLFARLGNLPNQMPLRCSFGTIGPSPVSRPKTPIPPRFSASIRAAPPSFSSHKRVDLAVQNFPSSSPAIDFLQTPQIPFLPTGDLVRPVEFELNDPAIIEVGKGIPIHLTHPGFEHETILQHQHLMQPNMPLHSNLNMVNNFGNIFIPQAGVYSNFPPMPPFPQFQEFISTPSNGHSGGWNEVNRGFGF